MGVGENSHHAQDLEVNVSLFKLRTKQRPIGLVMLPSNGHIISKIARKMFLKPNLSRPFAYLHYLLRFANYFKIFWALWPLLLIVHSGDIQERGSRERGSDMQEGAA